MRKTTHINLGVGLFISSALVCFFWQPTLGPAPKSGKSTNSNPPNLTKNTNIGTTLIHQQEGNAALGAKPSTSGFALSVRTDDNFVFDDRVFREKARASIELDRINQIPHHYDFWQNLDRDNMNKWTNDEAGLPEYAEWFTERIRLMNELRQSSDPIRKSQLMDSLRLNQYKRNEITEKVIAMAKAENPSLGQPRSRPETGPKTPPEGSKANQTNKDKLFQ